MNFFLVTLFLVMSTSSAFASTSECEIAIDQVALVSHIHSETSINYYKIPREQLSVDKKVELISINIELNEAIAKAKEICK
jgi:hypothetical protein